MTDEKRPALRKQLIWGFTAILLILGFVWLLYWLLYLRYHMYTDDAYANGNKITVQAAVPGSVVSFYADDTDLVEEGQLLVVLDCTWYGINYEKQLALLAAEVLQVRQLYENVKVQQAQMESKKIQLERAKYDFENRSRLVDSKAISQEDFVHAKDTFSTAIQDFEQAKYQLQVAKDAAGNTPLERHPRIEKQKGEVRDAYYNLQHCHIYAPAKGYVAERAVNVGEWVDRKSALMSIIPQDYVWVDANFKETQLTYMRVGQPASVWLDIYGSKVQYEGKVLGIASGSGSVFSIIPPQNATGNWIKIVQRLPVRISLNQDQLKHYPSRLGLSAEVDVDITNQDLPMLAPVPVKKVVGETKVFDIDLEKVNQIMDEVILHNLSPGKP